MSDTDKKKYPFDTEDHDPVIDFMKDLQQVQIPDDEELIRMAEELTRELEAQKDEEDK